MRKNTGRIIILSLALGLLFPGCEGSQKSLKFTQCQPQGKQVTLTEGQSQVFSCTVESRGEVTSGFHYQWSRDGAAAGGGSDYTFFGCGSATHTVNLTVTDDQSNSISQEWEVTLNPGAEEREACFNESLAAVHHGELLIGYPGAATDEVTLLDIQDCLRRSLEDNVCSLEGNYAQVLVEMALALRSVQVELQGSGGAGLSLNVDIVKDILDDTIIPLRDHLAYVKEFAPASFNFFVENNFLVHLQDDDPNTVDNESVTLNLFGNHDLSEVNFFLGAVEMIEGGIAVALSFNGLVRGQLPPITLGINTIFGGRDLMAGAIRELIQNLIDNPDYLTLSGPGGEEGKTRLLQAQAAIVAGMRSIKDGYAHVVDEKSSQSWHLFRYWDCGKDSVCPPGLSKFPAGDPYETFEDCGGDGICPGDGRYTAPDSDGTEGNGKYDDGEPYQDLNLNGRWNDSWANLGPDADGTEGNGKFDSREPFGTEMVLEMGQISTSTNPNTIMNAIDVISKNIEGPDPLLFSSLIPGGGMSETQIKAFLAGFGMAYPEIRLSQFFASPTPLRRMIPWYDKNAMNFITDTECEPFSDWGYDWTPDPLESNFDADKNPDPNRDDFNPITNGDDGVDSDRDGKIDESGSFGITADFGPEGNFMFDWIDDNVNRRHDAGETSEKFDDVGVGPDHQGAGNGAWDCFDREHPYPTGSQVGGEATEVTLDPLNTTSQDALQLGGDTDTSSTLAYMKDSCIDIYYLFFPDPTFSGVLTFPDAISNKDGVGLTKNAKLFRFLYKAIETAIEMDVFQVGIIKQ